MKITIDGQLINFNTYSLQDLLCACSKYKSDSIIILNNKYIKNNENYKNINIHDGDKIEIINFMADG